MIDEKAQAVVFRLLSQCGGVAQLGEHQLCKLGVVGSMPIASTTF